MAGRYPNTLFHFTKTIEALFGILEQNFKLSYAREALFGTSSSSGLAVPMVSFCDLRLSELAEHMCTYGRYGIGMSKKWAVDNMLNPVSYWSRKAVLPEVWMRNMDLLLEHVETLPLDEHCKMTRVATSLQEVFKYLKNYEGHLIREGIDDPNFRFANEREWRFVPPWEAVPKVLLSDIKTKVEKEAANLQISNMRLKFAPEDIRYLILEHDHERVRLIEHIRKSKGNNYPEEAVKRLSSRILTSTQILEDV